MSEFAQFRLLCRVHLRMFRTRTWRMLTESRLMTVALVAFLIGYSITAYLLFRQGLIYFGKLPAAGSLLVDRMLYIIFFCFFVMLVFSVVVTGYISLYRARDTNWLLTLPISRRVIFLWKSLEAALFSSWGLIFITAPLLLAFARMRGTPPEFYVKTLITLLPFVIIASCVAILLMITAVRWLKRTHLVILAVVAVIGFATWGFLTVKKEQQITNRAGLSAALTFRQVIRHTEIAVSPLSPSSWLASSVVDWTRPHAYRRSGMNAALLFSYAMMGVLVTLWLSRRWFYESWNQSLQNAAAAAQRSRRKTPADLFKSARTRAGPLSALLGRPLAAVTRKDVVSFRRDPAQWIQFVMVFGLLAIYAMGLRRLNQHLEQPRDLYLVVTLNLAVCALALSTLTTRFVFPQFSLEGRRLWILAMSPVRMQRVVYQKFFLSTLFTSTAVGLIVLISGNTLNLPDREIAIYTGAILTLSLGLNALAVGFGVLFPNLEETNAAKIVSGFGGTFCLVLSFVYIVVFLLLLTWARIEVFRDNEIPADWLATDHARLGFGIAAGLTVGIVCVPLFFAVKRLKRLEILGNP